jgi:protein-S-isoprenylcysteine O-methyltransferase Ste14
VVGDRKLADSLRRTVREVAEEKSADRWFPILSGIIWLADIVVCVLDIVILQHGRYSLTYVGIAGVTLFIAGLGLIEVARRTLGKFFSEAVRILPEHKLITRGPYSLIRHPIYLGEILFVFSITMIANSLYGFVIMLVIIPPIILNRIRIEEKILVSRFGQEYLEYTHKTKKLIPYIY